MVFMIGPPMLAWLLRRPGGRRRRRGRRARLFDRRDSVVDRETCLPLQPVGLFGAFHIAFMLRVRDVGFQVVHVVGNLRLHGAPVSARRVVGRLDFSIDLFDRFGRSGMRLFPSRYDLVVRFLFGRIQCLFGALGADRQVGELLRESLGHVLLLLRQSPHRRPI